MCIRDRSIKGDIIDINPDSPAFDYHFEVKDQKKLMVPKWWEQIYSDLPMGKTPVNVFKMNAKFYATLEFKDWLSLLVELKELKETNVGLEEELESYTHGDFGNLTSAQMSEKTYNETKNEGDEDE